MAREKEHLLAQCDLDTFQERVRLHMNELGMRDWSIGFEWLPDEGSDALAQVDVSVTNHTALFQLNPRWTDAPTSERLRRAAYHEVLEVLLSPMRALSFDEDLTPASRSRLLNTEAHAIIRRLEYLAYGPSDDPKASA